MNANRYETLDGWRGLAALAVTFYHLPVAHALRDFGGWKNLEFFVDFFFVLSGFVICHAWGRRITGTGDAMTFMNRRFWRVWPLHIIILAMFLAIEIAKWLAALKGLSFGEPAFTGPTSIGALLSNIVLVQALNLHGTTSWNGPAWSISVEFWTYVTFAAVMLLASGRTWVMALVAAAGALAVALFSPIWLFATHDFGLPRALYGFFAGAVAYRLIAGRTRPGAGAGSALEIAAVLAMAVWMAGTGMNWTSLLAPIVFVGLVVVFSTGRGMVSRFLLSKPVQLLGLWSYSIYLVHTLIFYLMRILLVAAEKKLGLSLTASGEGSARLFSFGGTLANTGVILGLLALTVAVSAVTYRLIEKPFMVTGEAKKPVGSSQTAAVAAG